MIKKFSRLQAQIICFLLVLMPLFDILFPAKIEGTARGPIILFKTFLLSLLIVYFIINLKKSWFKNKVSFWITTLIILHVLYLIFSSSNYIKDVYGLGKTLIWYFGFFVFLDFSRRDLFKQSFIRSFFLSSLICVFCLVIFQTSNELLFRANREYGSSNHAYYLCFILPYVFLFERSKYKYLAIFITFLGVVISFKRGAMLLLLLIILALFFTPKKFYQNIVFAKRIRFLIITSVIIIARLIVYTKIDDYAQKFSDLQEIGQQNSYEVGSGRGALYFLPIDRWWNSDLFHFIFGYGFNSTPDYYPTTGVLKTRFYAHSDWVMLIHDYGVLGFTVISIFLLEVFRSSRFSWSNDYKLPLLLLGLAFLIKSLLSGFILYEYSVYGFALLGFIYGDSLRKRETNFI